MQILLNSKMGLMNILIPLVINLGLVCGKPDYDIVLIAINFKKSFGQTEACDFKIKKTDDDKKVLDGSCILTEPLPNTTFMLFEVFDANPDNNGYRSTAMDSKSGFLCDFIKNDTMVMEDLRKNSNLPKECPILPMKYDIDDFPLKTDSEDLPDHMPGTEKKRCDITMLDSDAENAPVLAIWQIEICFPRKKGGVGSSSCS